MAAEYLYRLFYSTECLDWPLLRTHSKIRNWMLLDNVEVEVNSLVDRENAVWGIYANM